MALTTDGNVANRTKTIIKKKYIKQQGKDKMSVNNKKNISKTHLNPAYRIDAGVNSRRYGNGDPIEIAAYIDSNDNFVCRDIDQQTSNGGIMTPFNILCNATGACAVKKIIFDGDETIVLFADGDKVVVHRHSEDAADQVTAVLWALGEKVFGMDVARQIKRAIKYRASNRADLHAAKPKSIQYVPDTVKPAKKSII